VKCAFSEHYYGWQIWLFGYWDASWAGKLWASVKCLSSGGVKGGGGYNQTRKHHEAKKICFHCFLLFWVAILGQRKSPPEAAILNKAKGFLGFPECEN
jgi:hypothetical protein